MSDTCPKCGGKVSEVGGWFGPIMSHEPNDATCLRNQIAQLREQLAKAEAEAKQYREALQSIVDQWVCRSELFNNDRDIAENIVATARIAIIPPAEQGTTKIH